MNTRKFSLSQSEQQGLQQREAVTDNVRELKRLQAMSSVVEVISSSRRTIQR